MPSRKRPSLGPRPIALCASLLLLTSLSGCGRAEPPVVTADTSCESFRHISATDAQIGVFRDNWSVMETYADQIIAHNMEYDRKCLPSDGASP